MNVERISIFLVDGGTKHQKLLGEVPVDRGAFTWNGALPLAVKPGPQWQYAIALAVNGAELYRTSITITAP